MLLRVALGCDHGGFTMKNELFARLKDKFAVTDVGAFQLEPADDYPDPAYVVAQAVTTMKADRGIIICGSGVGACVAANKVPGVRAACCHDISSARNSREHNHANVLTLGGRLIGEGLAMEIVKTWLGTPWGGGRHEARVEKITEIERRYLRDRGRDEAR